MCVCVGGGGGGIWLSCLCLWTIMAPSHLSLTIKGRDSCALELGGGGGGGGGGAAGLEINFLLL